MTEASTGERAIDPRGLRRAQPLNQPLPATLRWIDGLPSDVRPLSLLRDFPRIANGVARAWNDSDVLATYLDSLLHDRRGGRRGFPADVHAELMTLHDYAEGRYQALPVRAR
jgi:hypothetical protein